MDLGLRLWHDGYRALPIERTRRGGGDAIATTMLGRRAAVVRGRAGAELFYDPRVVARSGAVPPPVKGLLFGHGAVHGLDGEEHAERKAMFLRMLSEERVAPLAESVGADLRRRTSGWRGKVVVFDELVQAYGTGVLAWAGIPSTAAETRRISHRMASIVDGFGGAGAAYPKAWAARLWGDRWARRLIERVRSGDLDVPADSVLAQFAATDLEAPVAAVELINILRPTVAVAWPATFAALALAQHPEWRSRLADEAADHEQARRAFGHEVRRTAPFVPALAGRIRADAVVGGVRLRPGDRIVLDVPGTDQDEASWHNAESFNPERFLGEEPDPYAFVPQGGGDTETGHRCPGEPLTVRLIAETVGALAGVDYEVVSPATTDLSRIPTLPARRLVVKV